ncbi:MAG: RluA family pseudouridine synthase [Bacteroidales bacterium]
MKEKQSDYHHKNSRTAMKRPLKFRVGAENELLSFLYRNAPKKKAKTLLKHKLVKVNGETVTQYNHPLKEGDLVEVHFETSATEKRFRGFSIVFEDEHIIVIDKHAGLLSISTDKRDKVTAYRALSKHVKLENEDNKIFIVHRLDRDTSGLMIFAKNEEVKRKMQDNWKDMVSDRIYLALIEGKPEPWSGSITSYLYESKALKVHVTDNPEEGDKAVTHYKILKGNKDYTLLKVWLETGRKNQIRVQLADKGFPIVGDKKYGSTVNPIGRLALHAWTLNFEHPVSGEKMSFKTDIPRKFSRLV